MPIQEQKLLQIWRKNLADLELQIAQYAGEAPVHLLRQRDLIRVEIQKLEQAAARNPVELEAGLNHAQAVANQLDVERLRRELSTWQANLTLELQEALQWRSMLLERELERLAKRQEALERRFGDQPVQLSVRDLLLSSLLLLILILLLVVILRLT